MRIHEYLEITKGDAEGDVIRCLECGHIFCGVEKNYKESALVVKERLEDVNLRFLTSGEETRVIYYQYICPGCGVLLEVDSICPDLNSDDSVLWDIQLDSAK